MKRIVCLLAMLAFGHLAAGQTLSPPDAAATKPAASAAAVAQNPEFLKAADEVLAADERDSPSADQRAA